MYLYVCLYSGSAVIGVQQERVSICLSIFGFCGYRRSAGACIYMFVYIQVLRLRTDLQREHERKMTEMRDASRRMKEDCDHQIQLERSVSLTVATKYS